MSSYRTLRAVFVVVLLCAAPPTHADVLEDILERGTLRVGVSLFRPWTMETESGELIGSEIDLARQLAADIGVEPEFQVYVWEEIIAGLKSGDIDLIAGGMAITPARALEVNFTRPYAESGVALAANTSRTRRIDSLAQLDSEGIIVAATEGTLAAEVAQRVFRQADVRLLRSSDEAERLVLDGAAHVYVASLPEAVFLALQHPDVLDLPLEDLLLASSEALAVRKGEQEWLNYLNAWIEARRADNWLAITRAYWFETIDWLDEVESP